MNKIISLDIEPSSYCNLRCPFCFGPEITERGSDEAIDLNIWKNALQKFRLLGVENIVVSGGEPLLYDGILELLSYLKFLDFNIALSTNGRIQDILFSAAKYCSWISLPIDGISPEINQLMRTDYYGIENIIEMSNILKSTHKHLKIKFSTVATKTNLFEISNIGYFLEKKTNIFDTWKIYQYTPRRKCKHLRENHFVSDDEFDKLSFLLTHLFSTKIRMVCSSNKSRLNAYVFIYENGDVNLVNTDSCFGDICLGNINRFYDINFSLANKILSSNHISNYISTY